MQSTLNEETTPLILSYEVYKYTVKSTYKEPAFKRIPVIKNFIPPIFTKELFHYTFTLIRHSGYIEKICMVLMSFFMMECHCIYNA